MEPNEHVEPTPTKYVIVNKESGEVVPVTRWATSHESKEALALNPTDLEEIDTVTVHTPVGDVVFENENHSGDLTNEVYEIREATEEEASSFEFPNHDSDPSNDQ